MAGTRSGRPRSRRRLRRRDLFAMAVRSAAGSLGRSTRRAGVPIPSPVSFVCGGMVVVVGAGGGVGGSVAPAGTARDTPGSIMPSSRARSRTVLGRLGLGDRHPQVPLAVQRAGRFGLDRVVPLLVADARAWIATAAPRIPNNPTTITAEMTQRRGRVGISRRTVASWRPPPRASGAAARPVPPDGRAPRRRLGRSGRGHDARSLTDSTARSRTLSARRLSATSSSPAFHAPRLSSRTVGSPRRRRADPADTRSHRSRPRGTCPSRSCPRASGTTSPPCRPPGASTARAPSRASVSCSSSRLTSMRIAWNVRFAGMTAPPARRGRDGVADHVGESGRCPRSAGPTTMARAIRLGVSLLAVPLDDPRELGRTGSRSPHRRR